MTVIVVGAGIAGLACARELVDGGVPVRVLERARVVGGRLASIRVDGRYADIGAGYLTADQPGFQGRLESWRIAGLARPWTDTFDVYRGAERAGTATGPTRWTAPGGLRSLAEDLAGELNVTLEHEVRAVAPHRDTAPLERSSGTVSVDGVRADAVVVAMPGPQALRLLSGELATLRAVAGAQRWSPVLAAVLTYAERSWRDFHAAFVNDAPVLEKVFDDGDRRGDRAPVLVAHSTPGFARQHLGDPAGAADEMAAATSELLGVPPAAHTHVHRWTYATPEPPPPEGDAATAGGPGARLLRPGEAFSAERGVFLTGDAFGRPRVQTAWLSGRAVARAIIGS